jgi:hypothetical protein
MPTSEMRLSGADERIEENIHSVIINAIVALVA